jgi:hypothetical protein
LEEFTKSFVQQDFSHIVFEPVAVAIAINQSSLVDFDRTIILLALDHPSFIDFMVDS